MAVLFFHFLVLSGVALVAAGASNLATNPTSASDLNLAKIGSVILFGCWFLLAVAAILTALPSSDRGDDDNDVAYHGTRLLIAVLLTLPFVVVRAALPLASFASGNGAISGATGSLGARIGLYAVPELLSTLALLAAGIMTRNVRREAREARERRMPRRQVSA